MKDLSPQNCFSDARRLGLREYNKSVSNGQGGYLPSLEGLIKNTDIVSEVDLGIIEIPLKKIVGTYSHSRSLAFAKNFMPLLSEKSEFQEKWTALCKAHLKEGIRHSIKVYEYLNWFYVIEGNKRVSVLKYFDAYAISGSVTRLVPKIDEDDINIKIYYEFLKFNKLTHIFSIWFSKEESFKSLTDLLECYNPQCENYDTKYKYFEICIYNPFRRLYLDLGGQRLPITTGDAFLEYIKIYGIPDEIREIELRPALKEFMLELESMANNETMEIQTTPIENTQGVLSTLTSLVLPQKKLKVAFAYARSIDSSGWTNSHELGRLHVESILGDQIVTSYIENVPENDDAYFSIKQLAEEDNDIIFTTSPIYLNATLKCALEYPHIKFFNCSEYYPYIHVANYYGRTYEPRFLTGIIAGSLTKSNIIGYIATNPAPEVISSINAFALGAKLVNPYAKVKVGWTNEWNSRVRIKGVGEQLIGMGADILANKRLKQPNPISKEFGVFSMLCGVNKETSDPDKLIAAPLWNWGLFYEKILRNILNGTFRNIADIFSGNSKVVNFWWGIAAGVLDIFYIKENIPQETEKLVNLMRKMIIDNGYHPFTGPIYDDHGILRIENDEVVSHEQILTMDWYVDNVEIEK